jgi:tripartite-type tricarboxylate transporter receptor subunit TctC
MGWLGSVTSDISLCVTSQASPIKTWDDLMTKSARMGGQASGSDPDNFAQLLKNLFGSNLRLITGFPGNNELALAMERNEIDGYCGLSWSSLVSQHPDWIKEKKVNYIVQAGMSKESPLPDTPTLMSRTNDPRKLAVLKMIVATQALARPFATSPDLPQERLAALQEAFARTTADPEFLAEAQKLGLDVSPVEGAKISAMLDEVYAMPQDVVELARQAEGH